ncbi:MAG: hypothetical protein ACLRWH_07110 [Emergencia sp.]
MTDARAHSDWQALRRQRRCMTDARAHSDWQAAAKTKHSAYGEMSVHTD